MTRAQLRELQTDTDRLLSMPEAAELLSVSPRTIANLIRRGILPKVKVGRATRVRLSDLERLVRTGAC